MLRIRAVQQGSVKWFNAVKGFGFILLENGEEVFVHHSQIVQEGYRKLRPGDAVTFDVGRGPKGLFATNVRPAEVNRASV